MTTAVPTDYLHPEAIMGDALLAYARQVLADIIDQLPADLVAKRRLRAYTVHLNARLTSTYGYCRYGQRRIEIADRLAEINPFEQTDDTIRHEIAHAIAGYGGADSRVHHGPHWKAACALTGADPTRCHSARTPRRWIGRCTACDELVHADRPLKARSRIDGWAHGSDCPMSDTLEPRQRRLKAIDLRAVALRAAKSARAPQENTMTRKYTVTITTLLDGQTVTNVVERSRKDDAIGLADRQTALGATCVVRTPGGKVVYGHGADIDTADADDVQQAVADADEVVPATLPLADGRPVIAVQPHPDRYRQDRIPAGATEYTCTGCGDTRPVTKFPTTRDKSRRTECRDCRDARRAQARG